MLIVELTLGSRSNNIARGIYRVSSDCDSVIPNPYHCRGRLLDLIEEHVLSVTAFGREVLEVAILADSMLLAQLLPELTADCCSGQFSYRLSSQS